MSIELIPLDGVHLEASLELKRALGTNCVFLFHRPDTQLFIYVQSQVLWVPELERKRCLPLLAFKFI